MKHAFVILWLAVLMSFTACKSQKPASDSLSAPIKVKEVSQIEQLESTSRMIEAQKQSILGNYSRAVMLYADAVKIDPRNSAALYELAKLHAQQGYTKDAETFALQAVRLDPDNKYFNLALADIYFMQNKNDEGLKVQNRIAARFPNDMDLQISLLSTLVYIKRYDEAIQQFEKLEAIAGFNNEISIQKQKMFLEMERTDLALEEAKRLVSFFPMEISYLELLADLYNETGNPQEAYKIYHQMLEIEPDNPMAHLMLADYYRNNQQEDKSFEQLKLAFATPQLAMEGKARIMASYYYLTEEDPSYLGQALELCKLLVNIHPEEAQAHAIYGDFLNRENNFAQAWDHYSKAASLNPSELGYWQLMLSIEAKTEDFNQMIQTSEKALEYFFEQPILFYFNGIANLQLKNYNQAIKSFHNGSELAIDEPELMGQFLVLLADTYHKVDNHEKSYYHYEEALALNPENAYALNNYSYYMSVRNQDLDKALTMSAKSLELEPDNASFQDTFGWIKYKLGDYQQAQVWIKKAIDNTEEPSAVLLEHYGDVLYKLGRKDEALSYWRKALDLHSTDQQEDISEYLPKKVAEGRLYE